MEIQAENCKANRLALHYQWKEGRIAKGKYAIRKDKLTKREEKSKRELDLLD